MKISERILAIKEQTKEYKGVEYDIKKDRSHFKAEIEGEEIDGTKAKDPKTSDKKAKEYIDQVI